MITNLCGSWSTRIVATTKLGSETSWPIYFKKGLHRGDVLCPRLFMLSINPVAWKLNAMECWKLSKPIGSKETHLLFIDDLKVFAASKAKLYRVLKVTKSAMGDLGLQWNPKKCSVIHVKKGVQAQGSVSFKNGRTMIGCLGAPERILQEEKLAPESTVRVFLQRTFGDLVKSVIGQQLTGGN